MIFLKISKSKHLQNDLLKLKTKGQACEKYHDTCSILQAQVGDNEDNFEILQTNLETPVMEEILVFLYLLVLF